MLFQADSSMQLAGNMRGVYWRAMPEVHIDVRWPDGTQVTYYSPSTVVRAHFHAGERYSLAEFLTRARAALHEASERVRARHGHPCSAAARTLLQIEAQAKTFSPSTQAEITVLAMND